MVEEDARKQVRRTMIVCLSGSILKSFRRMLQLSVFVISIGVALLNPYIALAVWIVGWVPAYFVPVRRRTLSSKGDA